VEQVAEEVDSLKESLNRLSMRQQKRMQEAKERAELIERAVHDLTLNSKHFFLVPCYNDLSGRPPSMHHPWIGPGNSTQDVSAGVA